MQRFGEGSGGSLPGMSSRTGTNPTPELAEIDNMESVSKSFEGWLEEVNDYLEEEGYPAADMSLRSLHLAHNAWENEQEPTAFADELMAEHDVSYDDELPSDYELCSDCLYDHEYEPEAAQAWHKEHGAPNVDIDPDDDEETMEKKLSGMNEAPNRNYEATVNVVEPELAIKDARKWNLRGTKQPGTRDVTFEGNYGDLMNFLTGYLSMTDAEADIEVLPVDVPAEHNIEYPEETTSYERLHGYSEEEGPPQEYTDWPDQVQESHDFDKFMDRILITEHGSQRVDRPEDNPQRRRAARRQDRPSNRTFFGKKQ